MRTSRHRGEEALDVERGDAEANAEPRDFGRHEVCPAAQRFVGEEPRDRSVVERLTQFVHCRHFPSDRDRVRYQSTQSAMEMIRRGLLGLAAL